MSKKNQALEPHQIPRQTKPGHSEEIYKNFNTGRLPVKLSQAQAKAFQERREAEEGLAAAQAPKISALPVVRFPTKVRLTAPGYEGYTDFIGGVSFENGQSVGWSGYRQIMAVAAGGFPIECVYTGVAISPLTVGEKWVAENQFWVPAMGLPDWCQITDNAVVVTDIDPSAVVATKINPGVVSADQISPVAMADMIKAAELKEPEGGWPVGDEILEANSIPVVKLDVTREHLIDTAIRSLRPGHKEDWTDAGLPDCGRLTEVVEGLLAEAGGDEEALAGRVTAVERNKAWEAFNQARLEPEDKGVFSVPAGDDLLNRLEALRREKGVRTLREIGYDLGLENLPRSADDVIKTLIDAGLTLKRLEELTP